MNIKYFIIILSTFGVLSLYLLSLLSQSTRIELSELPNYEDKQVIVEGKVVNHYSTSYGGRIIEIVDTEKENTFKATVFVEHETTVEYGDIIQVAGKVQRYKDYWELVVSNPRFITIIQKWQDIPFPLWQLAETPEKYIGINVNVTGFIDRLYENFFYLQDLTNEYVIVVFYNSDTFPYLFSGAEVYVSARFEYDAESLRYVLHVTNDFHEISLVERV